jgi:hypothetical protein
MSWEDILKLRRKIPTSHYIEINGIKIKIQYNISEEMPIVAPVTNIETAIKSNLTGHFNDEFIETIIDRTVKRYRSNVQNYQAPRTKEDMEVALEERVSAHIWDSLGLFLKKVYDFKQLLLVAIIFEEMLGFMDDNAAVYYARRISHDIRFEGYK